MKIIISVIILIVVVVLVLVVGWWRTYKTQHSSNETLFRAGTVPSHLPDGFYKGNVTGYHGAWQGKKFDAVHQSGINVFLDNNQQAQRYRFVTYQGQGLRDSKTTVIKIDYSKAPNPWYAKLVLDEVVQTAPNRYLGKIHLRLLPGVSFAIGYFTLER